MFFNTESINTGRQTSIVLRLTPATNPAATIRALLSLAFREQKLAKVMYISPSLAFECTVFNHLAILTISAAKHQLGCQQLIA